MTPPKEKEGGLLSSEARLSKLEALRRSVDEALDDTWDRTDKGFRDMGHLLDDLLSDEERRKADWYTPCATLYAWLELTRIEPHTHACEVVDLDVYQPFVDMLADDKYQPEAVRRLGDFLVTTEAGGDIDVPDGVWAPFERLYDDADPDADNRNMN